MGLLERLGFRSQGSDRGIVGRSVSSYGSGALNLQAASKQFYRSSAIVYQCVQKISTSAAALQMTVLNAEDTPNPDHPIAQLFNKSLGVANDPKTGVAYPPPMSTRAFKELLWQQLEITGEAFIYVDRGASGEGDPSGIRLIFDPVDVLINEDYTAVAGYRVFHPRGKFNLLPSEMMWLRYPNPSEQWGCQAPLQAVASTVDADLAAMMWQRSEFQNGAKPSGVVYLGDIREDLRSQIRAEFDSNNSGPKNAGKHLFLSGPVQPKYDRMGLTPSEMSFIESRKANADDVMMGFGLNRDFMYGGSTFQNRREAVIEVWTGTIVPKLDIVASQVDLQLLPDPLITADWDTSEVSALRENEDSIAKRVSLLMNAEVFTINDGRDAVDLEPLPNGDLTISAYRAQFNIAPAPAVAGGGGSGEMTASSDEVLKSRLLDAGTKIWERLTERQERVVERQLTRLRKKDENATRKDAVDVRYWQETAADAFSEWAEQVRAAGGNVTSDLVAAYFVHSPEDAMTRVVAHAFRVSAVEKARDARNRRLGPIESKGVEGLKAAFRAQERWLLLNLGARPTERDALPNPQDEALVASLVNEAIRRGDLGKVIVVMQQESMQAAVETAADDFGLRVSWDLVAPKLGDIMNRMALRVNMPEETLRGMLQQAINEGLQNGETFQVGIADRVAAVFDQEMNYGALRIARTETLLAYRDASGVAYREAGVEQVELYDGTEFDEECAARNGMVVSIDEADAIDSHPNCSLGYAPLVDLGMGSEEAA